MPKDKVNKHYALLYNVISWNTKHSYCVFDLFKAVKFFWHLIFLSTVNILVKRLMQFCIDLYISPWTSSFQRQTQVSPSNKTRKIDENQRKNILYHANIVQHTLNKTIRTHTKRCRLFNRNKNQRGRVFTGSRLGGEITVMETTTILEDLQLVENVLEWWPVFRHELPALQHQVVPTQ